jgi:signal transduction histidine kinase
MSDGNLVSPLVKKHPVAGIREGVRLADFINENTEPIVSEWEIFAKTRTPAATDMSSLALRDHIKEILAFIVSDIKSSQTSQEQIDKSRGEKEKDNTTTAAETHAAMRLISGFDIDQMVSEYRALRASVIKLWSKANKQLSNEDLLDVTRFNEAIDQALAESVSHYTKEVNYSKDLFIGVLSHDLRNPLGAISIAAQLMLRGEQLSDKSTKLAKQISESAARTLEIVNDLLDVTRARFGSGLPIMRAPIDMSFVSRQLIDEMRLAFPNRKINLDFSGELKGEWDKARIGQVFSNLIGNAIQYSFTDSAIDVTVEGTKEEVLLSVHNEGVPIPPDKLVNLFDFLTRAVSDGDNPGSVNLGLGLYIVKDIIVSHGGTIEVTSTEEDGTTFTARLPRLPGLQ